MRFRWVEAHRQITAALAVMQAYREPTQPLFTESMRLRISGARADHLKHYEGLSGSNSAEPLLLCIQKSQFRWFFYSVCSPVVVFQVCRIVKKPWAKPSIWWRDYTVYQARSHTLLLCQALWRMILRIKVPFGVGMRPTGCPIDSSVNPLVARIDTRSSCFGWVQLQQQY